jgi:hypothetical protein
MNTPQPPVQQNVTDSPGRFSLPWVNYFSSLAKFLAKPTVYYPVLAATWSNYSPAHQPASYYKDSSGIVHLSGLIKKTGAVASGEVVFTLPEGFRPLLALHFVAADSGAYCQLRIGGDGIAQAYYTIGAYVSLDGISFMVA